MGRAMIDGILLEGLNYSGKTTLGDALSVRFAERGRAVARGKGWIGADPLSEHLQAAAIATLGDWRGRPFPDPEFLKDYNFYKSINVLLDSYRLAKCQRLADNRTVHIQDRHWFSIYCNDRYFDLGAELLSERWIESAAPSFRLHVFLTCSQSVRERRAAMRKNDGAHHRLREYIRDHLREMEALERFYVSRIPNDPSWMVVSTDDVQPGALAERVIAEYDARSGSAG